ncbi:MAG: ATP phosphoribosyltransferase regulatory subunit [Clostridiaceae bacterium]|jgi:ATP phosphoribosyltransferase regulatory subunit|nr:ATP phosphoribosyltransferase regulatory subunit [Clostridiaceae bacterium]
MKFYLDMLKKDEKVSLSLRGLYEKCGYKKYRMSRFEEFSLYAENKNFLGTERILTFNDIDGKLLALKPDVTLSIVKNTKATRQNAEKFYYIENVYRFSQQSKAFKEISQMGLELLGDIGAFETAEVVLLALRSLNEIDSEFVLDISHTGFLQGLFEFFKFPASAVAEITECIGAKNPHDLTAVCMKHGLSEADAAAVKETALLSGSAAEVLKVAKKLCKNQRMKTAVKELSECTDIVRADTLFKNIRIDFSIINDIGYYGGLIFKGYVAKVPRHVLSGGRYDNLLKRFSNDLGAIGFALYLDELAGAYPSEPFSVDVVILYDGTDAGAKLYKEAAKLLDAGKSFWIGKELPRDIIYKRVYKFADGRLKEANDA